jgi:two-component system chemotaxis sensor kinase CheA
MDLSEFFQMFFEESIELLEDVEKTLLNLNVTDYSDDEINLIFRGMHSIKGGSSTFGFTDISEFTHTLETFLDYVRNKALTLNTESVDLLLKSVDCIRGLIAKHQGHEHQDLSIIQEIQEKFAAHNKMQQSGGGAAPAEAHHAPAASSAPVEAPKPVVEEPAFVGWHIYFKPYPSMLKNGNDPLRILSEIKKLGPCIIFGDTDYVPLWEEINFEESYMGWNIFVETSKTEEDIKSDIFDWVLGECTLLFREQKTRVNNKEELSHCLLALSEDVQESPKPSPTPVEILPAVKEVNEKKMEKPVEHTAAAEPAKVVVAAPVPVVTKKPVAAPAKESPSIRVATEKVDEIINIVGELVITQAILKQVISNKVDLLEDMRLKECLSQFSQNIRELQERAMVMRMLPVSNIFNRFPRMVRDIAQQIGKKIELRIVGENTELDKTVMEKIGDPLVHLVRNSIDHGIEETKVRLERNKPEVGVLELHAYHQGSAIIIDIIDDGNGLNTKKIHQKAVEKGLISEDQTMTDDEIHALIFLPGFSTADQVTDISGRGVGMDVVKKNIQAVGGVISVFSNPGQGSRFSIKLPLTLSIIDGQILTVSGQTFIFPIISIVEIIQIRTQQVSKVAEDNEVYFLRNKYIPMVHLTHIFDLESTHLPLEGKFLVIVEISHTYYGIVIDELLGQQQIVIKSIEQNFEHVEGIAGATVLGDGTVALIIDVTGLVHLSAQKKHISKVHYE